MRSRLALPVACYAVLLVSALQTLVVPVVANIQADLGVSATSASWVVTANLLAAAVFTPMLGRLGDLHGQGPLAHCALALGRQVERAHRFSSTSTRISSNRPALARRSPITHSMYPVADSRRERPDWLLTFSVKNLIGSSRAT